MRTRKQLYFLLVFFTCGSLLLSSCKKEPGPQGDQGVKGDPGLPGPAGSTILNGTGAPESTVGKVGDFYLDVSTANLYGPKTSNGWGSSLNLKGTNGATGPVGPTGVKGTDGTNGTNGVNGNTILSGTGIPASSLGAINDYYLDKGTYNFYGPKTATGWGVPTALQGPQGPMGNANIKMDIFSITNSDWLWNSSYSLGTSPGGTLSYFSRYYDRSAAALTSGFLNGNGIVMIYVSSQPLNNPDAWIPLPLAFPSFNSEFNYNFYYDTFIGKIRLHFFFNSINSKSTPTLSNYPIDNYRFKIVIATGTVVSSLSQANIDKNDKVAVAKFLGVLANGN